jgi:hypothetical protein
MATRTLTGRENLIGAARMTLNNEIIDVAEVLNEVNDPIADAHIQRANGMVSHTVSRRTALPAVSWVKVGNGWDATTGTTNQAVEAIGTLKARYLCPQDVMRIQPNPAKYRAQQERAYIEAMGQEVSNTLIGNYSSNVPVQDPPEEFAGLNLRYSTLGTARTAYVVGNGDTGATDDTSIWFVQWGPGKVYLIYPRNSNQVGIKREDKGLVYTHGDNAITTPTTVRQNKHLWAYVTEFSWDVGLCIEDLRCVKRLANIDSVAGSTYTLNEDYIIQIRNNFVGNGTIYMYCNETVFTQLQILAKDKRNVQWSMDNPFGKPIMYFLDMPVRRCDGITNTETSLV